MSLQSLATKMPSPPGTAMSNTGSTRSRSTASTTSTSSYLHGLPRGNDDEVLAEARAATREARQMWTATGKPRRKQEQLSITKPLRKLECDPNMVSLAELTNMRRQKAAAKVLPGIARLP